MIDSFGVKVIANSRKEHKCFACEKTIKKSDTYIQFFDKDESGKLQAIRFCVECGNILAMCDIDHCTVKPGGFTESKIPNCLRKRRDAWRKEQLEKMKNETKSNQTV